MNCRACEAPLTIQMADLKSAPASNSYLVKEQLNKIEPQYPLKVWVCDNCWLAQIDEYKNHSEIFNSDYAYFSSYSQSWLEHCEKFVQNIINRLNLNEDSLVIEIASNDGYLLQYFLDNNIQCLGIEPSSSTAKIAKEKGIDTIEEFFGKDLGENLRNKNMLANLVIGNNVLAHVPDIIDFVGGIKLVLNDYGTATMEFPHLLQLLNQNQFDTIYHEHFSYLSLNAVQNIFNQNRLRIYDVDELPTHGGSLRIYICHDNNHELLTSNKVDKVVKLERDSGLLNKEIYLNFQSNIIKIKSEFTMFLKNQKLNSKKVIAYGAAAKGNTLLNYCEVNSELIEYVCDASPFKQGKFLPGSKIPICSEKSIKESKPDYIVILPWNIKQEIMNQLYYVREWGCKFVVAIPSLKIE